MTPDGTARERARLATFPAMGTTLGGYAPQILALLLGGLLASLGATWAARSARGRAALLCVSARGAAFTALGALALGAGGAYLMVRVLARAAQGAAAAGGATLAEPRAFIGVGEALTFGVLVGLPLALPGLFFAWSDAHRDEKARAKRRDAVPTKDDRRAFADDLVRQIQEASPRPREVSASIGGDGGRVLVLSGDIDAEEGERLTAALRRDLSDLGFERVEGAGGDRDWWARV